MRVGLDGHQWTLEEFEEREDLPQKIEFVEGRLFWNDRERVAMLAALMEQMGLREVVRLAPLELWRTALDEAAR